MVTSVSWLITAIWWVKIECAFAQVNTIYMIESGIKIPSFRSSHGNPIKQFYYDCHPSQRPHRENLLANLTLFTGKNPPE